MPTVHRPNEKPEYDATRKNEVVGITPANIFAVAWVNDEGRKSMCLAIVFGKDSEDEGPGVFILADEMQMKEQLKMANSVVKKGVRKHLASGEETTADDVPANLSKVGIDEPMESPADESQDADPLSSILPQ